MSESEHPFIPLEHAELPADETVRRARELRLQLNRRRSLRMFSDRTVPRQVIEDLVMAASSAPSGANKQPWTFCAVSNPAIKSRIRQAAEKEEYENYHGRMPDEWLQDLQPFGTDWEKPFLEIAPWLIIVFRRSYEWDQTNPAIKKNNYYVTESVGLATGFFISAVHQAGLVCLTHTPSPMNFLISVLDRPANEKPFLLLPVGYPAENAQVPNIQRKSVDQVAIWYE